jgi:hypothetical protein
MRALFSARLARPRAFRIPNVLVVHDVRIVKKLSALARPRGCVGLPFIVSELLFGRELRALLEKGPLLLEHALEIAQVIADTLACAHAAGVIHRDLKPENLFLENSGRIKVLDFGLAESLDRAAESLRAQLSARPSIASPGYTAPEQLRGEPASEKNDLFAFGVVCFEMLTGERPFGLELDAARMTRAPPIGRSVRDAPRALEALIASCLELDPAARPKSALEVLYELWRIRAAREGRAPVGAPRATDVCPFPGLRAFDESEARFFFGRSKSVKECFDALGSAHRWLAIEGSSGAGKSSLARAGIVPAFRAGVGRGRAVAMARGDRAARERSARRAPHRSLRRAGGERAAQTRAR